MTQEQAERMSAAQAIEILVAMRAMMRDQHGCPISDAYFAMDKAIKAIEERKTGRWIGYDSDSDRYDEIKCSDCGKHFTVDADRFCDIGFVREDLHYCPNCGAKMEE